MISLTHKTSYVYERPVSLHSHVLRLAPYALAQYTCRSYSLTIDADHQIFWQQDVYGNRVATVHFNDMTKTVSFQLQLDIDLRTLSPFGFLIDQRSQTFPFLYQPGIRKALLPFLSTAEYGPRVAAFLNTMTRHHGEVVDFLADLTGIIHSQIAYDLRYEKDIQTSEETLLIRSGSCRDSAWLMVELLRHLGLASRYVSGFLIQIIPAGGNNLALHAWAEVFIPGAGWIGLDTTSGLFAAEQYVALAVGPSPQDVSPVVVTKDIYAKDVIYSATVVQKSVD